MDFSKGINIGDHFEELITTEKFEYPIKDWYFDIIKKCGFDHIRLPVNWAYHCEDYNGYRIDKKFVAHVERAVTEFVKRGYYVILNIHHFREAADDPKSQLEKLVALWEQIADIFKDYSDRVIFEVMNEPTWRADPQDWNEVQNYLISVIRKTNPTRQIMICGVDYSGLFALKDVIPPKDDKNLIGTFHYYFPVEFTHQSAPWSPTYKDLHDLHWEGTEEEKQWCVNAMLEAKKWSEKYGLPVNLGEFGVYKAADMESRCRWTNFVKNTALSYGFSFTYWELNRNFAICEKNRPSLIQPLADALIK